MDASSNRAAKIRCAYCGSDATDRPNADYACCWDCYRKMYGHATPKRAAKSAARDWPTSHHAGHEICGYCGERQPVVWHADDELYQSVTEGAISCPACFTLLCEWNGIKIVWRPVRQEDSTTAEGGWAW